MNQNLARYHARSPRYILNTEDDSLIRVAGPRQIPWEEGTEIKNVSLTGLAFTAPEDLCPVLGEIIKIQFQAPGGKQMASYAIVTRLDPMPGTAIILVGLHFYKMEMGHRVVLAQGLARKLKDISDRERIIQLQEGTRFSLVESFPQAILMANFFVLWAILMQVLSNENWLQTFKAWLPL